MVKVFSNVTTKEMFAKLANQIEAGDPVFVVFKDGKHEGAVGRIEASEFSERTNPHNEVVWGFKGESQYYDEFDRLMARLAKPAEFHALGRKYAVVMTLDNGTVYKMPLGGRVLNSYINFVDGDI